MNDYTSNAQQIRLEAQAIDHGRTAAEHVELDNLPAGTLAKLATETEWQAETFEFAPLSGEHAGESIPELFGYWPEQHELDDYEQTAVDAFYETLEQRIAVTWAHAVTVEVGTLNSHQLAGLAGTPSPDSHNSPGANYLERIRDTICDSYRYATEHNDTFDEDDLHQIIDGCVPVYTHELWTTFTDLAAYQHDVRDYGYEFDPDRPEQYPAAALYTIGMALASELMERIGNTSGIER